MGLTARYKKPAAVAVKPALFRALSQMIRKYPILSAISIAVDTTSLYFVRYLYITLSKVVIFVENYGNTLSSDRRKYLDNVLEKQYNRPFKNQIFLF